MVDKSQSSNNSAHFFKPNLTEEELKLVSQFSELIASKKLDFNPYQNDEAVIIRFLRARKMDLKKSCEMYLNYLKWHKENKLEDIWSYEFPEYLQVKKYFPHGFHRTDKLGRPLYLDITGDLNIDQLLKVSTKERLLRYQVRQYEYLMNFIFPACSQAANTHISQSVSIFDLKKHSTKFVSKKILDLTKAISSLCQDYYPETLAAVYIVNSGMMFKIVWTAVKPFLDEKTKKKIFTFGSDYKKKLLELIDERNLPKSLGGSCECEPHGCLYSGEGPWKNYVNDKISTIKNYEKININFGLLDNIKDLIPLGNSNIDIRDKISEDAVGDNIGNQGEYNNNMKIDINLNVNEFYNQADLDAVDENMDKMLKDEDSDEENRANLELLSKQLKGNLNFEGNNKLGFKNNFIDETPINTQEVINMSFLYDFYFLDFSLSHF